MKKATIFIVVALLLALGATPVYAADMPPLPHAFYGTVEINGNQARAGTRVEARGEGVEPGTYNPITTNEQGKYGSDDPLGAKLIVQGDISDGTTIFFYVDGEDTGTTYSFDSGETTELPLSVTITEPSEPSEPAPPTIETTIFGSEGSFRISSTGEILETIEATSEDGMLTVTIPEGTIALDKDGKALDTLEVAVDETPPDPPEGAYIIGLVYDFGPDGATFEPAITLTWSYDPDALPEGVAEGDLILAYYDEVTGEWVELEGCVVDTVNNTISAPISHFSKYAIIGRVAEEVAEVVVEEEEEEVDVITVTPAAFSVSSLSFLPPENFAGWEPGETVTITVSVTNTGGTEGSYTVVLKIDGVKEAEETVTIAAGGIKAVNFSVSREETGTYSVSVDGLSGSFTVVSPAPPKAFNWPLVGGIIAGVIVVGLLIYFLVVRPRFSI